MEYEVEVRDRDGMVRVFATEADDDLTAAFRAGIASSRNGGVRRPVVTAVRSTQNAEA